MSLKNFLDIDVLRSLILESIDEGIVLIDEKGIIHYANNSAGAILEESPEKLIGGKLGKYLTDQSALKNIVELDPFQSKEISIIVSKPSKPNIVIECKTKAIEDPKGKKIVILFSEVLKSSKLLRAILDYSPSYIFVKDLSERYLLLNKTYIDALKANKKALHLQFDDLKENDIVGKTDRDIFPKHYAEIFSKDDSEVLKNGKTLTVEYDFEVDKNKKYFLTSKSPLYDHSGKIFALCGIASEITSMKIAEKKLNDYVIALENVTTQLMDARILSEQANLAKSYFLANMSHELRTPLHGVIASASLLLNLGLNEKQQVILDRIVLSANILLDIINRILDFSKIEAGDFKFDMNPIDLREVVKESYSIIIDKAKEKKLELCLDIRDDLSSKVLGDFYRLQQIFLNLIGNAIQFTDKGTIKIIGYCKNRTEDKIEVRFEVQDTGIGIPKIKQLQLFDKFYQVDSSPTRKKGGSGLGLAITKQLISKMGGYIGVDSEPGKGSTFWFEIPFLLAKE